MSIGASAFLVAVGAILYWAVNTTVSGVNIQTVGVILMVVGAVALVLTIALALRAGHSRTIIQDGRGSSVVDRKDSGPLV